jgi:Tfp pilus assembly protein PilO
MNLSPRNTLVLTVVGVLLVIVALAAVLVIPQFGRMSELDAQIAAAEQEAQSARFLLEQRREVRNRSAIVDAKRMQLLTAFPEDPELTSVILELQELAYDAEVDLRSVQPQPIVVDPEKAYATIPVTVEFYSDWSEGVLYLQKLTQLSRQLRLVSFTARPLDPTTMTDINVDLDVYSASIVANLEAYSVPRTDEPAVPASAQ